jgi:hypothetical protein
LRFILGSQILINKFLRESIKERLGEEFLINKRISEIPRDLIDEIKSKWVQHFKV